MKVVLDTNVIISAVLFGGKSREILEMGISGKIKMAVSHDILKELAEVLIGRKCRVAAPLVQKIIHEFSEISEVVIVTKKVSVIKADPDDNRILECALTAKAHCIISGDNDLLSLRKFKKIKIVSPNDFLLLAGKLR